MSTSISFVDRCRWRRRLEYGGAAAEPDLDRESCAGTNV
jgi:hypothetical protein